MDQSLLFRAQRMLADRNPARLDHDVLMAAISAQQAASATARAQARAAAPSFLPEPVSPLVELLLGGPAWREAASAQQGCFNPFRADSGFNAS